MDTELACNRFIEDYMKQCNDIFLKVKNEKKIWMTQGLLISWKRKNKLYLKSKKYPTEVNIGNYKNYRNKFKTLKRNMERMYYEREFAKHSQDSKNTWRLIKSLLKNDPSIDKIQALNLDGKTVTDSLQLAQAFNSFFSEIGNSLEQKIPHGNKNVEDYLGCPLTNSFAVIPTTSLEIMDIAKSAKYTRSEGPDGIDPLVARKSIDSVARIISDIVNSSFDTGHVPHSLKLACITPIFKKGDRLKTTNYRPRSIRP